MEIKQSNMPVVITSQLGELLDHFELDSLHVTVYPVKHLYVVNFLDHELQIQLGPVIMREDTLQEFKKLTGVSHE